MPAARDGRQAVQLPPTCAADHAYRCIDEMLPTASRSVRPCMEQLRGRFMPEIARFFGIVIRMYAEPMSSHHRPHFHAQYQERHAVVAMDTVELIGGSLPSRQLRLVQAWAEIHQEELLEDWKRLRDGRPARKIRPLR